MSLRVVQPGTFSLLVDRGRPASRSLGVPLGGAADRAAFAIGNALIGNTPDAVALEMTLSGPTLWASHEIAACIFGAPFAIQLDGRAIDAGRIFTIRSGEVLRIAGASRNARAYLCVRGGFQTKMILNSGSALAPLAAGDDLMCEHSTGSGRSLAQADTDALFDESPAPDVLRVIDGPQADWFPTHRLFKQSFDVLQASNRMGVRLQGEMLTRSPREMVSEAVAPGAVQITNEGQPIILGVDGQTIGGYPKIAHVIRADLDRIAQLRPGQTVRFTHVNLAEAESLAEERRRKLQKWLTALRIGDQ